MRIVFICSSLEPGRDGVGDYTRALADELRRQNHCVAAIALRDHLTEEMLIDDQQLTEGSLPVLRLPAHWPARKRYAQAKEWIDAFDPDWLSLQFVIYGYHPKGLPFNLSKNLSQLGRGRKWHIMFHELWVGMAYEASFRLKLLGWMQKRIIQELCQRLKPKIVHTQTQLYRYLLADIGVSSNLLSIFSNIPVHKISLEKEQIFLDKNDTDKIINLVIFGSIHPDVPVGAFAREVAAFAKHSGIDILLTFLGRNGNQQHHWIHIWQQEKLPFCVLGEQSAKDTSITLMASTVGIATTAFAMIEKSGSVKAMLEHRLPVICVAQPFTIYGCENILPEVEGVFEYKAGNLAHYLNHLPRVSQPRSVQSIVKQLVNSLNSDEELIKSIK